MNAKTIAGFKEQLSRSVESKQYTLKRQYCQLKQDALQLHRTINRFYRTDGSLCRYYIATYHCINSSLNTNTSIDFQYRALPHGNSKKKDSYIRTKPSVINAIKRHGKNMKPKHVINEIEKEAGGVYGFNSQSDVVRNRRQV